MQVTVNFMMLLFEFLLAILFKRSRLRYRCWSLSMFSNFSKADYYTHADDLWADDKVSAMNLPKMEHHQRSFVCLHQNRSSPSFSRSSLWTYRYMYRMWLRQVVVS
jgi:hypothetical protein